MCPYLIRMLTIAAGQMVDKPKREHRRRPPEGERQTAQNNSPTSRQYQQPPPPERERERERERQYNRRDEDHQHRSSLPSRAMEGYNLAAEVRSSTQTSDFWS
jgi:hypothetical protein